MYLTAFLVRSDGYQREFIKSGTAILLKPLVSGWENPGRCIVALDSPILRISDMRIDIRKRRETSWC